MERKILLDENVHSSEILKSLNSMRREKIHCDFTIKVGSEEMFAHKNVLSAGSDYFKAMLSHDNKESQSGIVDIKECKSICVKKCIDFIYTGTGSVSDEHIEDLMLVAHMMQLKRLCDGISNLLKDDLSLNSFIVTKRMAKMYSSEKLTEYCDKFALENFCSIAMLEDFKLLEKEYISFLMAAKDAKASVADKCKALIMWTQHEPTVRVSSLEENFKVLDFSRMSSEYMRYLLEHEEIIQNSKPCWNILIASLMDRINIKAENHTIGEKPRNEVLAVFDKTSNEIQGFDQETKQWIKIQGITSEISQKQFVAVVVKDDLYVLGYDRMNYRLQNYSNLSSNWVRIADRVSNGRLRAVALGGAIYAFDDSKHNSAVVEEFQPSRGSWQQLTRKPIQSYECCLAPVEGYIHCIGGYKNADSITNHLRLDLINNSWCTLPNLPSGICYAAAVHWNQKIYVLGGSPNTAYLNTAMCFDIKSETWSTLACMNHARWQLGACVVGDRIYIVGGPGSDNIIEEYDPMRDKWRDIANTAGKNIEAEASFTLSKI